ncbi:hypothetical protein ERJ75_000524600 [Trypanosoma vivax]|nr:hypothetical protein ERJ75_000524600 [Trypanosoma vivax]
MKQTAVRAWDRKVTGCICVVATARRGDAELEGCRGRGNRGAIEVAGLHGLVAREAEGCGERARRPTGNKLAQIVGCSPGRAGSEGEHMNGGTAQTRIEVDSKERRGGGQQRDTATWHDAHWSALTERRLSNNKVALE